MLALGRDTALADLLRRPRYRGFVLTVFLSRTGVTMFGTSGVLLVLAKTGSAPLAGATAAAAVLPMAVTGPLLGAWLDVAQRRRVLIVADQFLSTAALLAFVALAGHAAEWTLPAVSVLYSVTRPFSFGTFLSALPEIAGAELLDLASAIEASSMNLSFVVGPALAGALSGATSPASAIELQAGITLVVALLVAINPAFEVRSEHRADSAMEALRDGARALTHNRILRRTGIAAMLAAFGWGMMVVGFPLYALRTLHAGTHAGGFLWAALASGSILGTVVLRGTPSLPRVAVSYLVLGISALLWPLAETLAVGILLIGFTGFLEGPAYSGTIALRTRHAPAAIRAQVMTTLGGVSLVAVAAGSATGGLVHRLWPLVIAFVAINAGAALAAARG